MGLFGSLFTGVSALFSQSQATAIVSNNIANVNTIGFKRSEASFNSLVTTESRLSRYSPGTVSVSREQRVDQQGSIQQTASATDAAISGNGFFPVKRSTDFGQEFLYTRAGQFSEDAQGLLRNAAGFVLYAWPIDSNGDLPANQGDLTSLVAADVAFLGGLTRPTNTAEIALNLDADETKIDPYAQGTSQTLPVDNIAAHFSRGLTVFDTLGSSQTVTMEFRHIVGPMAHAVSDASVTLESSDIIAGNGGITGTGELDGIDDNDVLTITLTDSTGATTDIDLEFVDDESTATTSGIAGVVKVVTVQDMLDAINASGVAEARLTSGGQVLIQALDPTDSLTLTDTTGTPASASDAFNFIQANDTVSTTGATLSTSDTIPGGGGASGVLAGINNNDIMTITIGSTAVEVEFVDTVGGGVSGTATEVVTVQDLLDAISNSGVGTATLNADGEIRINTDDPDATVSFVNDGGNTGDPVTAFGFTTSTYTFQPDYNIDDDTDTAGTGYSQDDFPDFATTSTPNTQGWWEMTLLHPDGSILTQGLLNFNGDGSLNASANADGDTIISLTNVDWGNGSDLQDFDIDVERFSQFSGNYDVISSDQDGAELGLRTGVELTRDGTIVARFSNGASADLYKIPLVTFANQNGLTEVSGTAYTETEESGEENLREAGAGGAGFVEASTLEASNVDLADEFAKLIVSQRAFGASTRVINTVDQMTEDLLRLR